MSYSQKSNTPIVSIKPVLRIENLYICADKGKEHRLLVKDLSLEIRPGETVALVGESGCGKSVTAGAVLGLLPHNLQVTEGRIWLGGEDITSLPDKKRRKLRGSRIGFVFQDYQGSFTPFIKVGSQLVETLRSHQKWSRKEAKQIALEWLGEAGLPAERVYESYPFQLSGGQLQRAAMASAMMLKPALLIADEPTTALDVLAGERVLDLLAKLQAQTGCAVLLISHDLRHVMKRADMIAVMCGGQLRELERADKIMREASHPYTRMLLEAKPHLFEIEKRHREEAMMAEALMAETKEDSA
ncbi:ABC transporter ATP-binding protein [Paenibacillus prosopidis]|uniref:ABC-type dipeptide/oligopeptide/nickel transport system ATPase component n=1 Tax=Paenibacillus prosopidis TaxID=630520 RepID=A0A368VJW4_9BACL|nr:ABC transporter ATP-binding protein [Paenibacillus prosopidis]RCW41741.1 ABC-type dipeptide/oligopeptide/nickel transport system ATPase component [Paenibacillus prosopidis]